MEEAEKELMNQVKDNLGYLARSAKFNSRSWDESQNR